MGGNGKYKWRLSFTRSASPSKPEPPKEFLCSIAGSLMADPVVVSSGQTFDRVSVQVCKDLSFAPILEDGSKPDFETIFPNLAIKSAILRWCEKSGVEHPLALEYASVEKVVRTRMASRQREEGDCGGLIRVSERELLKNVAGNPPVTYEHAVSELAHPVERFYSSSSEESVVIGASPETPLTRPCCYSSSSSSSSSEFQEIENPTRALGPILSCEEEELVLKLKSSDIFEQEQAVISLRKITRTQEHRRSALCTPRVISALKPLLVSKYCHVQVNAVATLVNLSLENSNKVRIVRSGVVPLLIKVLNGGFSEAQDHAAGALFSLAIEEDNRMAIGALGALPALFNALRSDSERTRHDSALALYNLTLVNSNRMKLVKLNPVPRLLEMVKAGNLLSLVLLILCNLAACVEGRSAMLDGNAVTVLVGLLRGNEAKSKLDKENCVAALYALSHGNFRFRGLMKEVRGEDVLREIEKRGSERARDKAKRLLEMVRERDENGEEENVDWEALLESAQLSGTSGRAGGVGGRNVYSAKSSDF
ncbi:U-box domain-containing protein 38-like [Rhodamnia argentea]|uniref:RING-type E3 ubiquitin transferase n=1 Tax=Rhodamnia argentea TaxID=178133 RepID=A0A8B8NG26_9MYRT|nr:U-box domain-containing protein 38-like [Rhodamnia argentea]